MNPGLLSSKAMNQQTSHSTLRGFTLVELMMSIAVLAILVAIALPIYANYQDRAKTAAFLIQLDSWREKAAVESAASGADLCNWNEAQFGNLRERIFGTTSTSPLSFADYQLGVTARDSNPAAKSSGSNRPFVVDVVATAAEGTHAINVARLIRTELDKVGLRYVSPSTDRDLPSIQTFSALLGNCKGSSGSAPSVSQGNVGAIASIGGSGNPPSKLPEAKQPDKPNVPPEQPKPTPNCGPNEIPTSDNAGCQPKPCTPGQQRDANGACYTPPQCTPTQTLSPDGKSCLPKNCPGGQFLHSDGSCGPCPGHQHLNPHGKCVGNIH